VELGRTLAETGLVSSMGSRGSALDNAACESVMATLKTEYVNRRSFRSRDAARVGLFTWIVGWYNQRRRHSALGQRSPAAFEAAMRAARSGLYEPAGPVRPGLASNPPDGARQNDHESVNLSTEVR